MNFYVRKLGHQECSYTAGKGGGHRGRYILISHKERHKESKSFLPIFDPDSENRSRSIGVIDDTSKKVTYCFFNWHKGKKYGQSKHLGSDLRFYLNKDSFPSQDHFRPGDYAVFYKYLYKNPPEQDHFYKIFRFTKMDSAYQKLEKLTYEKHTVRSNRRTYHGLFDNLDFIDINDIKLENFKFSKSAKKKYKNPNSTCHDSHEFREHIRGAYNFKCAIRGDESSIIIMAEEKDKPISTNLEAAHFWPNAWAGPLRPDNGMLLSKDLHWAFDRGLFTVSNDFKIAVHESQKNETLYKYHGKILRTPEEDLLKPNLDYLEIHRLFVFGNLKPIRGKPKGLDEHLKRKKLLK